VPSRCDLDIDVVRPRCIDAGLAALVPVVADAGFAVRAAAEVVVAVAVVVGFIGRRLGEAVRGRSPAGALAGAALSDDRPGGLRRDRARCRADMAARRGCRIDDVDVAG